MATDEKNSRVYFLHCDKCGQQSLRVDCDGRSKSGKGRIGICITPDCGNTKRLIRFSGIMKKEIQIVPFSEPPANVQAVFDAIKWDVYQCLLKNIDKYGDIVRNSGCWKIRLVTILDELSDKQLIDGNYNKPFINDYKKWKTNNYESQEYDRIECAKETGIQLSKKTLKLVKEAASDIRKWIKSHIMEQDIQLHQIEIRYNTPQGGRSAFHIDEPHEGLPICGVIAGSHYFVGLGIKHPYKANTKINLYQMYGIAASPFWNNTHGFMTPKPKANTKTKTQEEAKQNPINVGTVKFIGSAVYTHPVNVKEYLSLLDKSTFCHINYKKQCYETISTRAIAATKKKYLQDVKKYQMSQEYKQSKQDKKKERIRGLKNQDSNKYDKSISDEEEEDDDVQVSNETRKKTTQKKKNCNKKAKTGKNGKNSKNGKNPKMGKSKNEWRTNMKSGGKRKHPVQQTRSKKRTKKTFD